MTEPLKTRARMSGARDTQSCGVVAGNPSQGDMAFPGRRKNGNPPPRHQDRESTPQTPAVGIHPPDPRHVVLWLVTLPTQGDMAFPGMRKRS